MESTIEDYIRQLFPGFEAGLKQILVREGRLRTFSEGETLVRTGQYFKSTLLLVEGLVKLYREDEEGNEYFMYYLSPGQACALSMVCALRNETSTLMAKAATDTKVIAVPLPLMEQWMSQYRGWYQFVLGSYRQRFEELLQTIDQVAFKGLDERLEFYLKKHQRMLQSNDIPLSHQEIATELNSSREVVSRLLKKMEQLGKVKLHRSYIRLVEIR